MKSLIPLSKAEAIAAQIVTALKPFCSRIEIAGSIRRRVGVVGDIDLVCIPSDIRALRERIVTNKQVILDGQQNVYVRMASGIGVNAYLAHAEYRELFTTNPCNFGSLMICRTGPREFNIALIEHAKTKGLHWNPQHGLYFEGKCVAAATEEEIFAALDLQFIDPIDRETTRKAGYFPFAAFRKANNVQSPMVNAQSSMTS